MRSDRLYIIKSQHKLPELGGIVGPVLRPMKISEKTVIALLNRGVAIYEVNPANYKDTVRVTFRNVHSKQFYKVPESEKKTPRALGTSPTHNVYEKVANSYNKSVRRDADTTTTSTTSESTDSSNSGKSGKGRDLPKGKRTTLVEQSSEAETVSAEKAEQLKAIMNGGKASDTSDSSKSSTPTPVKSSDF